MAEPIIGRRSEDGRARAVRPGRARWVDGLLIEGEAGIGKTALLQEGVHAARASGSASSPRPGGAGRGPDGVRGDR